MEEKAIQPFPSPGDEQDEGVELYLNVWERMSLISAIGSVGGLNVQQLRDAWGLMDAVDLTDIEKAEVGIQQLPDGRFVWVPSEAAESLVTIRLSAIMHENLKKLMEAAPWSADHRTRALFKKVGI